METSLFICNLIAKSKHPNPAFPCLHNSDLSPLADGREVSYRELHPLGVQHKQLVTPIHHPVEATVGVLAAVNDDRDLRDATPAPGVRSLQDTDATVRH